jgi:hypothetical protein
MSYDGTNRITTNKSVTFQESLEDDVWSAMVHRATLMSCCPSSGQSSKFFSLTILITIMPYSGNSGLIPISLPLIQI